MAEDGEKEEDEMDYTRKVFVLSLDIFKTSPSPTIAKQRAAARNG
jgi:hypothetical protein